MADRDSKGRFLDGHSPLEGGGRPTKYDPSLCDAIITKMADGYSFTAACGWIGIAKQTGYAWCSEHPEFSDAKSLGATLRVLQLEDDLLSSTEGPRTTSRIFALKNADPEEWRDKHDHELSGPGGKPISFDVVYSIVDPKPDGSD